MWIAGLQIFSIRGFFSHDFPMRDLRRTNATPLANCTHGNSAHSLLKAWYPDHFLLFEEKNGNFNSKLYSNNLYRTLSLRIISQFQVLPDQRFIQHRSAILFLLFFWPGSYYQGRRLAALQVPKTEPTRMQNLRSACEQLTMFVSHPSIMRMRKGIESITVSSDTILRKGEWRKACLNKRRPVPETRGRLLPPVLRLPIRWPILWWR